MNWKLKAHAMALLSRTPGGRRAYHLLQARLGTNVLDAAEGVRRAVEIVSMVREGGGDPTRGVCLEIGTGWRPFVPFVLSLIGCERIITIDTNPWLNESYALETYGALSAQVEVIADCLELDPTALRDRYESSSPRAGGLADWLRSMRVEYRCPADARRTGLADDSIDFVCSSNVLEHIPPDVLGEIHRESRRILRPGGLAVHRINPGDHFANVDRSITTVNFLRFSERQWRWYGGSGLSYHNRLRCVQHRRLTEEAGLSVLVERTRTDGRALQALARSTLPVHTEFKSFDTEELAKDYMWVILEKTVSASTPTPKVLDAMDFSPLGR